MSTPKPQQQQNIPNQNRIYRGQHHKGDSAETQNFKYPKLPKDVSQELQQKVYSNSYKQYYEEKREIVKNKFDSLTLDNGQQYTAKPYCQMHPSNNKQRHPSQNYPQNYTINRLEESYWAKWKPSRCDPADNWQSYDDHTRCVPCNRRPRCPTTRTMAQDCMKMLAHVTNSKKRPKIKFREDKPLEIIREPTDIRESNSSDVGISKKTDHEKNKSKCSCCTCPIQSESVSDVDEKISEMTTTNPSTNKETKTDTMETSQEEYEHMYDEMYKEYESDLMNAISEYEMQREEEEMREVEQQLAEEERRRQERESQKQAERERARMSYEYAYAKSMPRAAIQEAHYSNVYEQYYDSTYEENEDSNTSKNETRTVTPLELSRVHSPRQSESNIKDAGSSNAQSLPTSPRKQSKSNVQELQTDVKNAGSPRGPQQGNQDTQSDNIKMSPKGSEREPSRRASPTPSNREREEQKPVEVIEISNKHGEGNAEESNPHSQNVAFDKDLTPQLSSSIEYSEPEIAILKHTDSFIINSRRQKEDRPRKPQPKFLKLTKAPFTAPPVKGHTYPLKPVLKKIKTPAPPAVGTTRPISPTTPKARTPSRQFQPAYLVRH